MFQGWKTILFGALIAALGTVQATDLAQVIPAGWEDTAMAVIGIVIMVLRGFTTTAVGTKTDTEAK